MGTVLVECVSECTCESIEIQAHTSSKHSLEEVVSIDPSEADHCTIRFTNLEKTLSGENKFKLMSLTVLALPNSAQD